MPMDRIWTIVEEAPYGVLATVDGDQPRVRPMAFVVVEGKLWSSTYRSSGKVREMEANPRVEVSFVGKGKVHARIEGIARLTGGAEEKERLLALNPKVGRHFSGGDDPKFVHIEIEPTRAEWTEPGFGEYHVELG